MPTVSMHFLALATLLLPTVANAQPTTLKLSYFTSDRSNIYQCHIQPFVEAVNRAGGGDIRIEVRFERGPRAVLTDQPKLILEGTTDIAIVLPSVSPDRFTDIAVMQLPGLFRGEAEATRVFTSLIDNSALSGFSDFMTIGPVNSTDETIHSRKAIGSLADLRGQTIRANNESEAATLRKLGANSILVPLNETMDLLGGGRADGVTISLPLAFEFGFARLTLNHYLLPIGPIPATLAMSRTRFNSLPPAAQNTIRKFGGEWLSHQHESCMERKTEELLAQLRADPRRKVVIPSPADRAAADIVFAEVAEEWAAQSPRNRELLNLVKAEVAKIRKAN